MSSKTNDIYQRVTDQIIADLERGVRPWLKPWNAEHAAGRIARPLRSTGVPYRGINVLMLWGAAIEWGYSSPIWMTYAQAQELGGQVRKGERGSHVVYANTIRCTEQDEKTGEETERDIPFLKTYTVFNAEQVDNLPANFYALEAPKLEQVARIERAEAFVAATAATIREGGNKAFYTASEDRVQMPPFAAFCDPESYYATLAHELIHWTKHPQRLARDFGRKRFGDAGYAMEELVAELGAAFACAELDLTPQPRAEHAAYIGEWLKVLKADKRAIFAAASHAQRATNYLRSMSVPVLESIK